MLDHSLKSAVSEDALTVNMWKRPRYSRNLHEGGRFYHVSLSFPGKLISKMYTLVIGKILRVFDKYRVQDCENLPLPIQMQLSEKRKTFSEFCVPFLQSASNFKSFE